MYKLGTCYELEDLLFSLVWVLGKLVNIFLFCLLLSLKVWETLLYNTVGQKTSPMDIRFIHCHSLCLGVSAGK